MEATQHDVDLERGDSQLESFTKVAKIAIAMAITKTAPMGVSGRQHTQELCDRFQRAQLNWKNRAEELRRQVLALKQNILQAKHSGPADGDEDSNLECAQRDYTEDAGDTPHEESSALFPTPPSSSGGQEEASLSGHVNFLQSVLRLKSMTATSEGHHPGIDSTSKETVTEAISLVRRSVSGVAEAALSETVLQHAVRTIVQFTESPAARTIWPAVSEAVGQLLQTLLDSILTNERLNQTKRHEISRNLVLVIGSSPRLRHGVMVLLTRYVTEYSVLLRKVARHEADLDPVAFEGMYHVFWILEQLVRQEKLDPTDALCGTPAKLLMEQLDESLLHISTDFPLFALYVWHIGGLMDQVVGHR